MITIPHKRKKVSVHFCVNVEGPLSPFVLVEGNPDALPKLAPPPGQRKYTANFTKSGSQTAESFKWWFDNVFEPETRPQRANSAKVLLVLDNHGSHLMPLAEMRRAISMGILVFFLLTNTTQDCTVLDVSVFGPYKSALLKHKREYDNQRPFSDQLLGTIDAAVTTAFTEATIRKGFVLAGVMAEGTAANDIPVPDCQVLTVKLALLSQTRQSLLAIPAALELAVMTDERKALLDERLANLKVAKVKELYKDVYERGGTTVPQLKLYSAAAFTTPYVDELMRLEEFAEEDKRLAAAAKVAKKLQKAADAVAKKAEKETAKQTMK